MDSRHLLLHATMLTVLGGMGLMRPGSVAATSTVAFELCAWCEPNMTGCPTTAELQDMCDNRDGCGWGWDAGCWEFGTCTGDKRLINCIKPVE